MRSVARSLLIACNSIAVSSLLLGFPSSAEAHGEQVVFLFTPGMIMIAGGVLALLAWRTRWLIKGTVFAVLVASIAATWFLPMLPREVGDLAAESPARVLLVAAGVPIVASICAFLLLRRVASSGRLVAWKILPATPADDKR